MVVTTDTGIRWPEEGGEETCAPAITAASLLLAAGWVTVSVELGMALLSEAVSSDLSEVRSAGFMAGWPDFLCWYIPYFVSKSVPQEHLKKIWFCTILIER